MSWYKVIQSDISKLPECLAYYETEYKAAKSHIKIDGKLVGEAQRLPAIMEYYYAHLQDIETILEFLNIQLKKIKSDVYKKYTETYKRQLTPRDVEQYTNGDEQVVSMCEFLLDVAIIRNKFLGITKAIDAKNYMLKHVVSLYTAGLDEIELHDVGNIFE